MTSDAPFQSDSRQRAGPDRHEFVPQRPAETALDVLFITDLRFPGGTSTSLAAELTAARAAGYTVGVLHLANPRLGASAPVHPLLRRLLDGRTAHLVLPGEPVVAALTVVKHPMTFAQPLGGPLPVTTELVVVATGQVPADAAATYYDAVQVDAHIAEALGSRPRWAPVSATVRASLHGVEFADEEWSEIIDVDAWRRTNNHDDGTHHSEPIDVVADERLVIGRHSRPDRLKWPDVVDDLTAVYPTDGSVRVRVLGGADAVVDVLGAVPDAWDVLPFGSLAPQAFLAELDAFVYYHHRDLTEAFGRTILEALAVGIAVVVPHHFETTFGDACIYAEPQLALAELRRVLDDPEAHCALLDRAERLVRTRFSEASYAARLERLIGPPIAMAESDTVSASPLLELAPPALRASHTITLFSCLGASSDEVEAVLAALDVHRRHAPGFIPVVVTSITRPALAVELGIETKVITNPSRWDDADEAWVDYAQRRLRQLAAHYQADNITAANPADDYAWIALQLRRGLRRSQAG